MSKVHEMLQAGEKPERRWYLRIRSGEVFGPTTLSKLCQWVEQTVILPDNEISEDHNNWVRVDSVAVLKMEWIVEVPGGKKIGPFNIKSIPKLIEKNIVSSDAVLVNKVTKEVRPAVESAKIQTEEDKTFQDAMAEGAKFEQNDLFEEESSASLLSEAHQRQEEDRRINDE